MKKVLWIMLAWIFGLALSVWTVSAKSSDCLSLRFSNWDSTCLWLSKSGKNFRLSIDDDNLSKGSSINCYVITPDNELHRIRGCEWSFTYAWSNTKDVIISATYVLRNNDFYSKRISTRINFSNWAWASSSSSSSSKSSRSSDGDLSISVSPSNPDTYEWLKLTIETDDDYTGKIKFSKLQYRSSSSSSWSSVSSRTSSTYVSDYSNDWSNWYYKMKSSDDGEVTLKNLVKFKKKGYYRIYVEDTDGNEAYVQVNVDTSSSSSSSSNNDEIELSTNRKSPSTNQYVNLTIETDSKYTGKLTLSAKYRSSSSSSWSSVSNTSSTYFSSYSDEWDDGYYKMKSSDKGEITIDNLLKFKKSGYYRIYVKDTDGNEEYIEFNVDTSSSSSSSSNSDEIELSTNRKTPSTSQYVNLTINMDRKYTGKLHLTAKYKSSSSSSWSNVSNTSSTYFSNYSDEWEDGYYKMTSSDKGEVTLSNLVKFKKKGYYRIYVIDTDGNESYIQFNVGNLDDDDDDDDDSSVSWFTSSQLYKVKSTYKEWDNMIAQMERKYSSLKRDTYWQKLSDNFYADMKDVINNKKNRDFMDYEDFSNAFDEWYRYTMRNV